MSARWPWFTSIAAIALCLWPLSWEIAGSAVRYSPTDWLRDLWVAVSLAGMAILIALAGAEWWVRAWLIRRRTALKVSNNR